MLALPTPASPLLLCAPAAPVALLPAHAESLTRKENTRSVPTPRAYVDSAWWWEQRAFGMTRQSRPVEEKKKALSRAQKAERLSAFVMRQ